MYHRGRLGQQEYQAAQSTSWILQTKNLIY